MLISRELLGLDEFLFEGFEGLLIQVELDLQCPVCHALPLTEQGNHLIEDGVKVHRDPPKLKSLPPAFHNRPSRGLHPSGPTLSYSGLPVQAAKIMFSLSYVVLP